MYGYALTRTCNNEKGALRRRLAIARRNARVRARVDGCLACAAGRGNADLSCTVGYTDMRIRRA